MRMKAATVLVVLEISRKPSRAADPGDRSFDDPSLRHHLEGVGYLEVTGGAIARLQATG
jgi:hypothetical protein